MLIAKGADVNIQDAEGFTPLHRSAQSSHYKLVEFLLGVGGDQLILNKYKKKALDYCSDEKIKNLFYD